MGKNLSPVLRRELENLDKDSASRRSAMKALKSYVKDLDSKAIPIFLAQVSETKETGLTSGEYTISLYEVLARVHGTKIVPQIHNIMTTIIKTLTSSAGSFALHQACSKVVPAIARYGMDPTTPDIKKREIIHSLCKPLSDSLLASQENISCGAALCLKALVESDNWRFSSSEMVNEVVQRVAAALDKPMQVNSHMGLVMALAKHNGLVVEDYARLLIRSGVGIFNLGVSEGNSQKRLSAIQMVNYLMRSLDYKCIMSELTFVIQEFEKCQNDQMAYVKGAAFEAIQTAKRILNERKKVQSPRSEMHSPFSISFVSRESDSDRSVNRKLWSNVDVSLKDGLYLGEMSSTPRSVIENSETQGDYESGFSGFFQRSPTTGDSRSLTTGGSRSLTNGDSRSLSNGNSRSLTNCDSRSPTNGYSRSSRSATPSPQRSRSYVNVDNMNIFETPRKLVKSLQVPNDGSSGNQSRNFRSPSSSEFNWSVTSKNEENSPYSDLNECFTNEDEQLYGSSESVSSNEEIPLNMNRNNMQPSQQLGPETKVKPRISIAFSIALGIFVVLIAAVCFLWIQDLDEGRNLVPT
ncbi:Armadillo-like helical [Artemisia annua]|uniref:Armadillo-like helical n=1 Tax=Artemisia annua TaxID=35608 RepID=A0A2U1PJV4_ARTAN|nr:Armadillo-like helical [Artemisia annua]